jgi:hypothetical protein
MSITVPRSALGRQPAFRRAYLPACAVGLLAATAGSLGLAQLTRSTEQPPLSVARTPAAAAEGRPWSLSASERATVAAALGSPDARTRRLAMSVAAGEAGASALANPAILHHHGIDTATVSVLNPAVAAAERFHHR